MQHKKIPNKDLGRIDPAAFKQSAKTPVVVILDNVRSFNNVGGVFRTADAFRLESVYLCGITPQPPHRDIQKTALGATETVEWQYYKSTLEAVNALKKQGYQIYAIEQAENSKMLDLFNFKSKSKTALIFGNEVKGVDQKVIDQCDGCIEIPQIGSKHSLNITVSAGVVLWEAFKALRPE